MNTNLYEVWQGIFYMPRRRTRLKIKVLNECN